MDRLAKKLNDWFVGNSLLGSVWVSLGIILICLVLWLLVAVWLDPLFTRYTTAVLLDESDIYITVRMKTAVAADGQPIDLTFTLHNQSPVTQTVSLTTQTNSGYLQFTTPPHLSDVHIPAQTTISQTIAIANTAPPGRLTAVQDLFVTVSLSGSDASQKMLGIYVEGILDRTTRQFVNSTIQQNSPLIILIAFFVPLFIRLTQYYIKEEKKKRALEKEFQIEKVRQAISVGDFEQASELLKQQGHIEVEEIDDRKDSE